MGNTWSLVAQMFPPKPRWSVDDIPDLSGKVMLVTGGNTGCGKETVKALLQHRAKVYLAARDRFKAQKAIDELKQVTGREAIFLELDLADLASVRRGAETFLAQEQELHVLFNNAGVWGSPIDQLTAAGYDLQFGTNVIGHFQFTQLLMPALLAVADRSGGKEKARVVTTSSSGHYLTTLNWDSFKDGPARRKMAPLDLYTQSKFGNVVVANELARRHGDKIVATSLNPGNLRSDLYRDVRGVQKYIIGRITYPVPYGALTQLWAGTTPAGAELNGKFLIPWARVGECKKEARDPEVGRRLWEWLENECKGH